MPRPGLFKLFWGLTAAALVAGMTAPLFTFSRFYIFNNTVSLLSGVWQLLGEGEFALFALIFTFSVLLPVAKMLILFVLAWPGAVSAARRKRIAAWMHALGRWSMLDVFVVAVMVVTIKLGAVASVQVHYGLYVFAGAILGGMLLTQWVAQHPAPPAKAGQPSE